MKKKNWMFVGMRACTRAALAKTAHRKWMEGAHHVRYDLHTYMDGCFMKYKNNIYYLVVSSSLSPYKHVYIRRLVVQRLVGFAESAVLCWSRYPPKTKRHNNNRKEWKHSSAAPECLMFEWNIHKWSFCLPLHVHFSVCADGPHQTCIIQINKQTKHNGILLPFFISYTVPEKLKKKMIWNPSSYRLGYWTPKISKIVVVVIHVLQCCSTYIIHVCYDCIA